MSIQSRTKIAITAAIIVVAIASVATLYLYPTQTVLSEIPETEEDKLKNKALGIAQRFVVTTPTFEFDGDINTLDTLSIDTLESGSNQYLIKFSFNSTHEGYGNRENQNLTNEITPHTIEILVSGEKIISATTDEVWDELSNQSVTKNSKLQSSNTPVTAFDGKVNDYQSLIQAIQSRGLEVQFIEKINDSMFEVPINVITIAKIEIQIYEFDSVSDTKDAKSTVSTDGTQIGLNSIRWMDIPHFYSKGTIIVQYIGHNPEILNLLDSFLGEQFAGM